MAKTWYFVRVKPRAEKRGGKSAVVVNMETLGTAIEVAVSPDDIA